MKANTVKKIGPCYRDSQLFSYCLHFSRMPNYEGFTFKNEQNMDANVGGLTKLDGGLLTLMAVRLCIKAI